MPLIIIMSINGNKILCVVPARGGSKSIPKKNLQELHGVSLVGRVGNLVKRLDYVDRAIISTDSAEIAEEAIRYGLNCPFMRPNELANDLATSLDMWIHAWIESEKKYDEKYDISLLLEPTSPLRTTEDVYRSVMEVVNGNCAAVTVSKTPAHFTPEKTLKINTFGKVEYYLGVDGKNHHNRQTIPDYYHRNGICYAVSRKQLIEDRRILENSVPVIIKREVVNIDEPHELELAGYILDKYRELYD